MLIARNLVSQRNDYWIWLVTTDDTIYDIHWPGKPFIGTEWQKDMYVEQLAEQAIVKGLPLKEINVCPILRAK